MYLPENLSINIDFDEISMSSMGGAGFTVDFWKHNLTPIFVSTTTYELQRTNQT